MTGPKRMDAYVRVSRVGGREGASFISPAVQRDQIEGWAKLRSVEIVAWHEDLDQSGGKLERPGLEALLARIESRETGGVVVAKLDRLSRLGVIDALKLVERITEGGGTIAALDLGIDPTTATGELMMTLMLGLARMERRRIGEAWGTAKSRAVDRGATVSPTPYGYERREDGCLEPHPSEASHVTRAYELAASGDIGAATRYLSEHADGRYWTTATVRRMLGKRSYLGESRHGQLVNPDAHEPLVSRAVWEAAQHGPRLTNRTGDYPLSGIARCATCGGAMVAGPKSSTGKRMYRCAAGQTLHRGPKCKRPAGMVADRLEEYVRENVRPVLEGLSISVSDADEALAEAERELQDAEHELEAFASDLTARRTLGDSYHRHLTERHDAVEAARHTYGELAREAQTQHRVTSTDILEGDDPRLMAELLGGILAISVTPGRGSVEDRVRLAPLHGDAAAGE